MSLRFLFISLILLALAGCKGCSDAFNTEFSDQTPADTTSQVPTPAPEPKGKVTRPQQFKLQQQNMTVDVTDGMTIEDLGSFILICSSEVVREARCFTLEVYNGEQNFKDWQTVDLGNGRLLYSKINGPSEVEGGLKEAELEGYFEMDNKWYLVKCGDSTYEGEPDATWCLPYLASLRKADVS